MAEPYLVTLGLDPESFGRLDALRGRYFPPGRNVVPAHLSLFHQLPDDDEAMIRDALDSAAATTGPIPLTFAAPFRLGRGMAVRVEAPGLRPVHDRLVRAFGPRLTPQDRQPFRPHVTLMNKADPLDAALAFAEVAAAWTPWEGRGESLLLWRYLGGPWEAVDRFEFR